MRIILKNIRSCKLSFSLDNWKINSIKNSNKIIFEIMQSISFLLKLSILALLVSSLQAQVVCSEDELIRELREDIEDNGKLDCLRVSLSPVDQDETEEQKSRRLASQWDSDCSFEAESTGLLFLMTRQRCDLC